MSIPIRQPKNGCAWSCSFSREGKLASLPTFLTAAHKKGGLWRGPQFVEICDLSYNWNHQSHHVQRSLRENASEKGRPVCGNRSVHFLLSSTPRWRMWTKIHPLGRPYFSGCREWGFDSHRSWASIPMVVAVPIVLPFEHGGSWLKDWVPMGMLTAVGKWNKSTSIRNYESAPLLQKKLTEERLRS